MLRTFCNVHGGCQVHILSADGLRNADWLSSGSDPYCLCTAGGLRLVPWAGLQMKTAYYGSMFYLSLTYIRPSDCFLSVLLELHYRLLFSFTFVPNISIAVVSGIDMQVEVIVDGGSIGLPLCSKVPGGFLVGCSVTRSVGRSLFETMGG